VPSATRWQPFLFARPLVARVRMSDDMTQQLHHRYCLARAILAPPAQRLGVSGARDAKASLVHAAVTLRTSLSPGLATTSHGHWMSCNSASRYPHPCGLVLSEQARQKWRNGVRVRSSRCSCVAAEVSTPSQGRWPSGSGELPPSCHLAHLARGVPKPAE
jgi:hypothetical protein